MYSSGCFLWPRGYRELSGHLSKANLIERGFADTLMGSPQSPKPYDNVESNTDSQFTIFKAFGAGRCPGSPLFSIFCDHFVSMRAHIK